MSESISETIQNLTEDILKRLGIKFDKVTINQRDDVTYRINILTEDASLLIGHFGDTLKALQYVVKSLISNKKLADDSLFVICDVEGYKERQEEKVLAMADKGVEEAKATGEYHLPAMSPYFRKIVHMHLKQYEGEGIQTASEGEGDDRHIVIKK